MITFKFRVVNISTSKSMFITIDAEGYGKAKEYLLEQLVEGYGLIPGVYMVDLINPDEAAKQIYENAKYLLD